MQMGRKTSNKGGAGNFPAIISVVAAGIAGIAVSGGVFILLQFFPAFIPISDIVMIQMFALPVMTIFVAWLSARYAIRAVMKPVLANVRGHAALARLLGVGIDRLARGDTAARINIELPGPYETLAFDFNTIARTLQSARDGAEVLCGQLENHAGVLDEAALRLAAGHKLKIRVEADLQLITKLAGKSPVEALRIARNTLQGTLIAAQHITKTADTVAGIAPLLRQEAQGAMATVLKEAIILPGTAA